MCTIGAKIFVPGAEFILFKNRDFTRDTFQDAFVSETDYLGVMGVETWDNDGSAEDHLSGFSIGCNAHLACCDSNVRSIKDGENYDKLVQAVVENCASIDEAQTMVHDLVRVYRYHWANILIAAPHQIAVFSIHEGDISATRDAVSLVRANHHAPTGPTADDDDTVTSTTRFEMARDGLRNVHQLADVFPVLHAHAADSVGICNHSLYQTVSSYVVHWNRGQVTLYHHAGHPCDGQPYQPIELGQRILGGTPS